MKRLGAIGITLVSLVIVGIIAIVLFSRGGIIDASFDFIGCAFGSFLSPSGADFSTCTSNFVDSFRR